MSCLGPGNRIDDVLKSFGDFLNSRNRRAWSRERLNPKLDHLQQLLHDPVTGEETRALQDVMDGSRNIDELIMWLEERPVGWLEYPEYREQQRQKYLLANPEISGGKGIDRGGRLSSFIVLPKVERPRLSDVCPDCGSKEWLPIAYGRLTEESLQEARQGKFVRGGVVFRDEARYCSNCFNRWPSRPDVGKRSGTAEAIQRSVLSSRDRYAELLSFALLPKDPGEPNVIRAWERIDGSVHFLISDGKRKTRITKSLTYSRLGGAPAYSCPFSWLPHSNEDLSLQSRLAPVAALRFERDHEPERHNLFNEWDKFQAYQKSLDKYFQDLSNNQPKDTYEREELKKLLKVARAMPEKLPAVISVCKNSHDVQFLVRFDWGVRWVTRYRSNMLESPRYSCHGITSAASGAPDIEETLARAAALLAEYPQLDTQQRGNSAYCPFQARLW
jgi:hypothetical protein